MNKKQQESRNCAHAQLVKCHYVEAVELTEHNTIANEYVDMLMCMCVCVLAYV